MLRVVVIALPLAVLFGCNTPPPPPPGPGGNGNDTCDVGGAAIARPSTKPADKPIRAAGGDINTSCIDNPEHIAQSTTATVQGCIVVFGEGGAAKPGIKVAVFGDDQNPRNDTPAHGEVTIGVQTEATTLDCVGADADTAACLSLGCEKAGAYVINDVPLHIPLTMKVSLPGDNSVIDTYTFGIVFDYGIDSVIGADGKVSYEANLIYDQTYESIPTLAGKIVEGREQIGDGVGRGVIAGEIHDCDDEIIGGAAVTSDQLDSSTQITYFNGDSGNPLPDLTRGTTNNDGLYVIINAQTAAGHDVHKISAGILDPACAGEEDCACVSLGSRTVRVYPDSVSIVTLRGDIPVIP